MDAMQIIYDPVVKEILRKTAEVKKKQEEQGFNLFTISSYIAHLENFHSDILASLLNPYGLHREGNTFLQSFLNYLKELKINIEINNYADSKVIREKGRIDILILDLKSSHAIIIENKINDAIDQQKQLKRYYDYCLSKKYFVDAVLYLSLDGKKTAPYDSDKELKSKVVNLAAFTDKSTDLVNGWLLKILQNTSNEDSKSFLHQYCKLIKHLNNSSMNNEQKEAFYNYTSENNAIHSLHNLQQLIVELPDYRAEKFRPQISDHAPFDKVFKYQKNYWIFEEYNDNGDKYKLDVFFESNGNAKIVMWNYAKEENGGYETVKAKLEKINLLSKFKGTSLYNGFTSEFILSDYSSLIELDNAVVSFTKEVFSALSILEKNKTTIA